jgi:hypothetical protein
MLKPLKMKSAAASGEKRCPTVKVLHKETDCSETETDHTSFSDLEIKGFDLTAPFDFDTSSTSLASVREETTVGNSAENTDPPANIQERSVSFTEIEWYSHAIILGDNPSVSSGPPVALGNKLIRKETISVEDYEAHRPPRREKIGMCLSRFDREEMLRDCGYGRGDFRASDESIQNTKKHRANNAKVGLWEKLRRSKSLGAGPR